MQARHVVLTDSLFPAEREPYPSVVWRKWSGCGTGAGLPPWIQISSHFS